MSGHALGDGFREPLQRIQVAVAPVDFYTGDRYLLVGGGDSKLRYVRPSWIGRELNFEMAIATTSRDGSGGA